MSSPVKLYLYLLILAFSQAVQVFAQTSTSIKSNEWMDNTNNEVSISLNYIIAGQFYNDGGYLISKIPSLNLACTFERLTSTINNNFGTACPRSCYKYLQEFLFIKGEENLNNRLCLLTLWQDIEKRNNFATTYERNYNYSWGQWSNWI